MTAVFCGHSRDDGTVMMTGHHVQGGQWGTGGHQQNIFGGYHEATAAVSWPVVVGCAPLVDVGYQERPSLRSAIEAARARPAATSIVVFSGGAGTGKTQLAAVEFGAALASGAELAIWASASSRTTVVTAFAQAYAQVRANRRDLMGVDAEPTAQRLLAWLAATQRNWIVVLDDVIDAGDLSHLWPSGPTGRVVVTTRLRADAVAGRGGMVEVGPFTAAESAQYVTRRVGHRSSSTGPVPAGGPQLADDLGHLPLALALGTAYLLDQGLTCDQYRALLADRSRRLADVLDPQPPQPSADSGSLLKAWSLSMDRADALSPAGTATPLMELVAVGDAHGIPEQVVLSAAALDYLGASYGPALSREAARRGLRNLHNLHLVTHDPDGGPIQVRVHRLTQRVTREVVAPERVAAAVRAMADGLMEVWPETESDPALAAALRANTEAVMAMRADALWYGRAHPVLMRAGLSLGEVGLVAAARDHFIAIARTAAEALGGDHADTLAARHHLAHYRGQSGDSGRAAAELTALLADRARVLGDAHPDTLATRNELAYWLAQAGHPADAITVAESLLADQLRAVGPDDIDSLTTRGSLAYARAQAGHLGAAVAAFEELLADDLRILGAEHVQTLITRNRLASWRGQAGDLAGAVAGFRSLIADQRRVLGPDHPHTMIARHNLAHWTGEAGDADAAVRDCETLLADRLRVLGPEHPHTLSTRNNLAHWYGAAGDPALAARTLAQLLPDRVRILGPRHPLTLTTRQDLAWWTGVTGDWIRAVTDLNDLHAEQLDILGAGHLDTLATTNNLALCRAAAGQVARAAADLESLVAAALRVLGPAHPHTLAVRHNLEWAHQGLGLVQVSAAALSTLLADEIRLLGHGHPHTRATRDLITRKRVDLHGLWRRRVAGDPGRAIYLRGARGVQVGDGNTRPAASRYTRRDPT